MTPTNQHKPIIWSGENITESPTIIIEYPTGVLYTTQVGGMACYHPEVEGIEINLGYHELEDLEGISCPDACSSYGISVELAKKLEIAIGDCEPIFALNQLRLRISLDSSRLSKGTECFFPITVFGEKKNGSFFENDLSNWIGEKGMPAWLIMWDNCD